MAKINVSFDNYKYHQNNLTIVKRDVFVFMQLRSETLATGGYPRCWYRAPWHLMFRLPPTVAQVSHGTLAKSFSSKAGSSETQLTFVGRGKKQQISRQNWIRTDKAWNQSSRAWYHPWQFDIIYIGIMVDCQVKLGVLPDFTQLHSENWV